MVKTFAQLEVLELLVNLSEELRSYISTLRFSELIDKQLLNLIHVRGFVIPFQLIKFVKNMKKLGIILSVDKSSYNIV